MMRSMFSGVSGLRMHQVRMDVIGNNIANINTFGFRASRATFEDVLSQTLRGAAGPTPVSGGTNPQQIGLGIALGSIDMITTQGSLQLTGRDTDMAITGNGFFVLKDGGSLAFTRAGTFDRDAAGFLVNPSTGQRVQGWTAAADGSFGVRDIGTLGDITIPLGQTIMATETTSMTFGQNLDAGLATGGTHNTTTVIYDTLGNEIPISFTFTKTGNNAWSWNATTQGSNTSLGSGTLNFANDGTFASVTPATPTITVPGVNGAGSTTIAIDFTKTTQASNAGLGSTCVVQNHDGNTMGSLQSFTVDQTGTISGVYSNGLRRPLAQVAVGDFLNPNGLVKVGHNEFQTSNNSGLAVIGTPGTGGRGAIAPGNLEMSNVDISQEFTSMIITQRGFQANSRIITASDEMLQDLVNLKR